MTDPKPELTYVEIQPKSRTELEKAFAGTDVKEICDALYSAVQFDPDWRWAQGIALGFLKHPSLTVRSAAVMSLGELAVFRQSADLEVVLPALYALREDPSLAQDVAMALDDLETHIPRQ